MQGTFLGRYRIDAKLGEGGMGVVWRAHDPQLRRDVALKVLPDALVADPTARARLLREARAAAALNHPNILTVYDVGEADGHVYIAMEHVPGRPLSERIGGAGLPAAEALRVGQQVAAALAHAHERGVVHRDVKPSNVLITPGGDAKVLDFGIATRVASEQGETRTMDLTSPGALVGTPMAMAPELWRGAPADPRSDVWALGVLLHTLVAGQPPYRGATAFELSTAITTGEPAPLPERTPPALRAVIARCMEREPERRYGTAKEAQAALQAAEAATGTATSIAPRRPGWTAILWPAVAAAALVAIAILSIRFLGSPSGRPTPARITSLAVLPLENFSHAADQQYFADGMTDELITRLAQLGIVRVISRTSVMRFRGATLPMARIGRELGVDAIVEGSVEQVGNRVRISAQLVRAATDEHLWVQSYEREVGDALALQDEVAAAIAVAVHATLTPGAPGADSNGAWRRLGAAGGGPPLAGAPTPVAAAPAAPELERGGPAKPEVDHAAVVQAYLRGLDQYQRWNDAGERRAVALFDQALALDSTFAPALAARGNALMLISASADTTALGRAAIEKALRLDPSLGEAHAARANYLFELDWNWEASEREFKQAIALNPNDAEAHHQYSHLLVALGRLPEARAQAQVMLLLDPLAPASHHHLAWLEYESGRFAQAEAEDRKAMELDPGYSEALVQMANVELARGRYGAYRRALEEARKAGANWDPDFERVSLAVEQGRRDEAVRILRGIPSDNDLSSHDWSKLVWFAALGRRDEAFALLDVALARRDYYLLFANTEPLLAGLRGDPRYAALRRRMRLPA